MISGARVLLLTSMVGLALGAPWAGDASSVQDSQIVQSLIREVRAAPEHVRELVNADTQNAYLRKYDDGDGDEQGYNKHSDDEGGKGYKHFDSYHKNDGDKYGFQHETSFGLENKDDEQGEEGKLRQEADEADVDEDAGAETKYAYRVVEDAGEYYDAGAGSGANYEESADEDGDDAQAHYVEADDGHSGEYNDGDADADAERYETADGDEDY